MAFVSGPQQAACYVACKYGTSAYGLQQYMQLYPDVNAVYAALYGSPLCSSFSGIAVDNGPFDEQESALDNIFATATSDVSQVSTAPSLACFGSSLGPLMPNFGVGPQDGVARRRRALPHQLSPRHLVIYGHAYACNRGARG